MQLPFTLMNDSWICQPLMLFAKFNSMLIQWEGMVVAHHSFIQFMDWEEFLKGFPESVL
jgi:hypothetical protein